MYNNYHIRWMIRRDMPEVLNIENGSFAQAWTEEDFLRCLRQRNCIGMVVERDEKVFGFMIYELHKTKLHILNFAVHPEHRRLKIGQAMVAKLISKLSSHRRSRISLEVRETNLAAQLFFSKQGFRATQVLRGYYEDTGEDAFTMVYQYRALRNRQTRNQSTGSSAISGLPDAHYRPCPRYDDLIK